MLSLILDVADELLPKSTGCFLLTWQTTTLIVPSSSRSLHAAPAVVLAFVFVSGNGIVLFKVMGGLLPAETAPVELPATAAFDEAARL